MDPGLLVPDASRLSRKPRRISETSIFAGNCGLLLKISFRIHSLQLAVLISVSCWDLSCLRRGGTVLPSADYAKQLRVRGARADPTCAGGALISVDCTRQDTPHYSASVWQFRGRRVFFFPSDKGWQLSILGPEVFALGQPPAHRQEGADRDPE